MTILGENESDEKNKLSGWLSVSEINDNCRKVDVEGITWKIKAVTFCNKTKQLFISPVNDDEISEEPDSPANAKSPSSDLNVSSPKSETPLSRPRLDSQGNGLKQFFSKKLAISRSRSVGKMSSSQKTPDSSSPKSPNALWASWRSQEAETMNEESAAAESSINLADPNISIIRPIHPSVLARQYCFQVLTPEDMKYFCCRCEEEYLMWLHGLNSCVHCNRDEKIRLDTSLSVWIFEGKGVPVRKKYFCEVLVDKMLYSRTTAKYKDEMLFWGEHFSFEDLPPTESLTISLFRESDTKKKRRPDKNVFVGSSVIDLVNFETNTEMERWVSIHVPGVSPKLQQKGSGSGKSDQPSIRTKLKYETHVILPIENYKKLHHFIIDNYLALTTTLENSISLKTKDLLAQTLLKILIPSQKAEVFLVDIIMNEVRNTTDENLTFRGNSLATKSIDTYMKMVAKKYLQETLSTFIQSVYEMEEDTEVDPQKLNASCSGNLGENQRVLIKLVEDCWRSIFLSIQVFPKNLQSVFSMVREQCELLDRDIVKKIVSASLFLRLLCPAILSPSLFSLTQEYPNEKIARTLTLVAKTIQNLANFTRFGSKEGYMEILNDFVKREINNMDNFLQRISFEPESLENEITSSQACVNIDVARELSVIYHLLSSELPKLSPPGLSQLTELEAILHEIQSVYEASPKADELRLCRPFASVALVCSKPLVTPACAAREDTPSCDDITPNTPCDEDESRPPQFPAAYSDTPSCAVEDTAGSCSQIPTNSEAILIHSNSSQSELCAKNTFINSIDSPATNCKCEQDNFLDVKTSKDKSKSPLTERKQKQANRKKRIHAADSKAQKNKESTFGGTKDMFTKHDDLSKTEKYEVQKEEMAHYYELQNTWPRPETNHCKNTKDNLEVFQTKTRLKKRGGSLQLKFCTNGEKEIGPLMGTSAKRKSWSEEHDNDEEVTLDEEDSNDELNRLATETFPGRSSKIKNRQDRSKLKLLRLQNDHCFHDESVNSNELPWSDETVQQSCGNNFHSYVNASFSPLASANGPGDSATPRRGSSEHGGSLRVEKNNHCGIPNSGGYQDTHEGITSSSSNCACSSESYYSEEDEEEEYGTIINSGDRLTGVSTHHNAYQDFLTNISQPPLLDISNNTHTTHHNATGQTGEVDALRHKLRQTEDQLLKTQRELKTRSENFQQTVVRLREKLVEADRKMKAQRSENETQMKNVISRLLNVEGELRKEHGEMEAVIKGKHKMIEIQEKRIEALEGSNIRLLRALSNVKRNAHVASQQDEEEIDELLECLKGRGDPE